MKNLSLVTNQNESNLIDHLNIALSSVDHYLIDIIEQEILEFLQLENALDTLVSDILQVNIIDKHHETVLMAQIKVLQDARQRFSIPVTKSSLLLQNPLFNQLSNTLQTKLTEKDEIHARIIEKTELNIKKLLQFIKPFMIIDERQSILANIQVSALGMFSNSESTENSDNLTQQLMK